jgi:hypothetical protein
MLIEKRFYVLNVLNIKLKISKLIKDSRLFRKIMEDLNGESPLAPLICVSLGDEWG